MKTILCFGDSLTWGYIPGKRTRYPFEERWTGILQNKLGNKFRIVEEGLNGRTTVFEDPFLPYRSGSSVLPMLLESHSPIDLLIILLGSNDLKPYRKVTAKEAAIGCGALISTALKSSSGPDAKPPQILLLTPPSVVDTKDWMAVLFKGSEEESNNFSLHYREAANNFKIHFLDTGKLIKPSKADGVHLDLEANQILGEKVAEKVHQIYS